MENSVCIKRMTICENTALTLYKLLHLYTEGPRLKTSDLIWMANENVCHCLVLAAIFYSLTSIYIFAEKLAALCRNFFERDKLYKITDH